MKTIKSITFEPWGDGGSTALITFEDGTTATHRGSDGVDAESVGHAELRVRMLHSIGYAIRSNLYPGA